MRARSFRPVVDSLGARFLLSDTSEIVSGGLAASGPMANYLLPVETNLAVDDVPSVVSAIGWYLPDAPPSPPYNPSTPTQGGVD